MSNGGWDSNCMDQIVPYLIIHILAIFMGSTVLLVGGVLATLHIWRAVRPDPLEARNQVGTGVCV